MDVYIDVFMTLALVGGEWSASRTCRFTPGERAPGTQWIRSWVDPRADCDEMEK
jgi:disulfide bond formation protein DsbB